MPVNKRELLLQAGLELLSEKTFSEISMDMVAEKSKLSKPMIYYYFDNKEGYYRALADHLLDMATAMMMEMFLPTLTLRENLKRYITMRLDFVQKQPGLVKAFMHVLYDPNISLMTDNMQDRFERMRTEFVDPLFDRAVETGEIAPTYDRYLVLMLIHSTLIGYTMKMLAGFPEEHLPEATEMVDIIFKGISPLSRKGGSV